MDSYYQFFKSKYNFSNSSSKEQISKKPSILFGKIGSKPRKNKTKVGNPSTGKKIVKSSSGREIFLKIFAGISPLLILATSIILYRYPLYSGNLDKTPNSPLLVLVETNSEPFSSQITEIDSLPSAIVLPVDEKIVYSEARESEGSIESEIGVVSLEDIGELVDEKGAYLDSRTLNPYASENTIKNYRLEARRFSSYKVQNGDSLWLIAKKYRIDLDAIVSLNEISSVTSIRPGHILKIPALNGIFYKIKPNDSLERIQKEWDVPISELKKYNDLGDVLTPGDVIFLNRITYPKEKKEQLYGTYFVSPLTGIVSSPYGMRLHPILQKRLFHTGIDVAASSGTHVKSVADGTVVYAGENGNYGKYIRIKHANGYESAYAHLSDIEVKVAGRVRSGQPIGKVGSTGRSTGPHLHFEIKHLGKFINPRRFIKSFN